jgi:aminomethyltransferase
MAEGRPLDIVPAGLGARDVLRIEAGYPLYGNDINDSIHPFEARLSWVVKLDKKDFIGKDALLAINAGGGPARKRVGFLMARRGVPREGYEIYNETGSQCIGIVTSGTYSPNKDAFIGIGYVEQQACSSATALTVKIRQNMVPAHVHPFPFIASKVRRSS